MEVEIQLDQVESASKRLPRDSPYRIRVDAISMVKRGQSIDQVARTCGVSVSKSVSVLSREASRLVHIQVARASGRLAGTFRCREPTFGFRR
jgi:hypothetical protein